MEPEEVEVNIWYPPGRWSSPPSPVQALNAVDERLMYEAFFQKVGEWTLSHGKRDHPGKFLEVELFQALVDYLPKELIASVFQYVATRKTVWVHEPKQTHPFYCDGCYQLVCPRSDARVTQVWMRSSSSNHNNNNNNKPTVTRPSRRRIYSAGRLLCCTLRSLWFCSQSWFCFCLWPLWWCWDCMQVDSRSFCCDSYMSSCDRFDRYTCCEAHCCGWLHFASENVFGMHYIPVSQCMT